MLTVSLYTLGSPEQLTGGYLYHRRLAELAPDHDARLRLVPLPALPFPLPVLAVRRALQRGRPSDVAVLDSIAAAFFAPWRLPSPVAAMLHQPPGGIDHGPLRRRAQARLDRAAYRRCDLVILASETLAPSVPERRSIVIPPGRDVAAAPATAVPDPRRGRRAAFLSVGNWMARKGTLELLEAVAHLPHDIATLHLVGRTDIEPRYATRVRARLAAADLADRVVVHGVLRRDEVAALYRAADAFVLPSYREPYGTVYGEAMAAGLPVVGWRAGNLPNLATHDREGVVVEPGDVPALARALHRVATDDAYRARLAAAAARRAQQLPTWDETAARFFDELRRLAGGHHR